MTTNLVNNKRYIGQHSTNTPFEEDDYKGSGIRIRYAIQKYGHENFSIQILEYCDNKELLDAREIELIKELKPEYNISKGGTGGDILSPEQREIVRKEHFKHFENRAIVKFKGKYKYNVDEYIDMQSSITIECPYGHGETKIKPSMHLYSKSECKKCQRIKCEMRKLIKKGLVSTNELWIKIFDDSIIFDSEAYKQALDELSKGKPKKEICQKKIYKRKHKELSAAQIIEREENKRRQKEYKREQKEIAREQALKSLRDKVVSYTNETFGEGKLIFDVNQITDKTSKINIQCTENGHRPYKQIVHWLLKSKYSCPDCTNIKRGKDYDYSRSDDDRVERANLFVKRVKEKYNNKYDYDMTNFVNMSSRIILQCPIANHGNTEITAETHLYGNTECNECTKENREKTRIEKYSNIFETLRLIHGEQITYDKFIYDKVNSTSIATCKDHSDFETTITKLRTCYYPCPQCLDERDPNKRAALLSPKPLITKRGSFANTFEERLTKKFGVGKFSYNKLQLENSHSKLDIKCNDCDHCFSVIAGALITIRKSGCPNCAKNKTSKENLIARFNNIHGEKYEYLEFEDEINIRVKKHKMKVRCKEHNEVFEQSINSHLSGHDGCLQCIAINRKKDKE